MRRTDLINVAKDTMYYTEKYIEKYDDHSVENVEVFSPDTLQKIEDDEDEFFERSFWGSNGAEIYVYNMDSFEAAHGLNNPLVMNFANAYRPGGGFLNGAMAQEESLCRCSTLYKSISNKKASEMYDYNNAHRDDLCDSDYMLLSPDVYVFKDLYYKKMEPFWTSVVTIAAPDKKRRAKDVPQSVLDAVMKNRLRKMFYMAARRGYRELVLGAWGCGAFGHSTKDVATYFYELLIEEGFNEFFDRIVFAILGDERKIDVFRDVFGDKIYYGYPMDDFDDDEDEGDEEITMRYVESNYDMPICNHVQGVGKNNVGYTQGITIDGIPFEAEIYETNNSKGLSVIMPRLFDRSDTSERTREVNDSNVVYYQMNYETIDFSVLDIGMVDEGQEDDLDIIKKYVDFLVRNSIVSFDTDMYNGMLFYRIDVNGNELVKIIVTMSEDDRKYADTELRLRKFDYFGEEKDSNSIFKLVEDKKTKITEEHLNLLKELTDKSIDEIKAMDCEDVMIFVDGVLFQTAFDLPASDRKSKLAKDLIKVLG